MRRALVSSVVLIACAAGLLQWRAWRTPAGSLPKLVLWAWERPEDLRFIDPDEVAVAYLAGTIQLRGDRVEAQPRLQPLAVPPKTRLLAVVRVEPSGADPSRLSPEQRALAASAILRLTDRNDLVGTQVDFDARSSERSFYAALLGDLRRQLPAGKTLSITALASWCLADSWIAGLPIDEAVPMLFRMGPEGAEVRRRLRRGADFSDRACRISVGVSTDEPLPRLPYGRRIYVFHPRSWTSTSAANILREVKSWQ